MQLEKTGISPIKNCFNMVCTNGYEIENLRFEDDNILYECVPKETTDTIFAPVMANVVAKQFEQSTGLNVKSEDSLLLRDLIGLWCESLENKDKEKK